MTAFSDQNASIEFTGEQIVHVKLQTGEISTQLLRELSVTTKAHKQKTTKAIIFSLHEMRDPERFFRKACHKSEHIAPGTFIALVCTSPFVYKTVVSYLDQHQPDQPVAIFSDYTRGLDWIESKLIGTETIRKLAIALENIFVGMTA